MSPSKRHRRTALLCLHCLSNFAYFRAMREAMDSGDITLGDFNRRAANNFLDVGVLEWCKLFADQKAKHHWRKVVTGTDVQRDAWLDALVAHLTLAGPQFADYIVGMKVYRDKFVAHLDDDETMLIPDLVSAIKSAQYLFQRLVDYEAIELGDPMPDAPSSAADFYLDHLGKGQAAIAATHAV